MLPSTTDTRPAQGFENLYQEYHSRLLAHLTRLVHDRATAEDLCQDSFLKAMRNWDGRDTSASVSAWLYRIATNTAYDYLRRGRRLRFLPLAEEDPAEPTTSEPLYDEREDIQRALAQLPPTYRLPLLMHSYEGRSTSEIAKALGCSTGAVKTRLFRARERFRQAYSSI
jgi:RNA polymerase sigma-70 factor (ECF subfamily)